MFTSALELISVLQNLVLRPLNNVGITKHGLHVPQKHFMSCVCESRAVFAVSVWETDPYLFCEILVQRPIRRSTYQLPSRMTADELKYMQEMASQHFDKIMAVLHDMPRSLLYMIRNLNTIRAINRLHGHPVDRYSIMARSAITGIYKDDKQNIGIIGQVKVLTERCYFEYKLSSERFISWLARLYIKVLVYMGRIPDLSEFMRSNEQKFDKALQ